MAHEDASTVTERDSPSVEHCQQQVHRIIHSNVFRNALTLQQLFQFLASRTFEGNSDGLKEYTIGVEAFGRKPDFDPKTDTIVRVQIHRLRQKLKEYYDAEGAHDPVFVDIPKGHYLPRFEALTPVAAEPGHDPTSHLGAGSNAAPFPGPKIEFPNSAGNHKKSRFSRFFSGKIALALVTIVAFGAGFWIGNNQSRIGAGGEGTASRSGLSFTKSSDPVKVFWAVYLGGDTAPIVAYPDAIFLLDDSNDLFRFRQGASDNRGAPVDPHLARQFASNPSLVAKAGQLYYENGYTGTGELEGVAMLAGLFAQMGAKPTIKSSRDITPDDLKQHTVILLGSPFQNIAVAQLLTAGDFSFRNPDSQREQWRAQITNAHPRANEDSVYHTERDPTTQVLKVDYSVISIQPGIAPGRFIAIIGGLDTKGTEGATMFATSRPGVEELSKSLAASGEAIGKDKAPVFQALLRVTLEKGYQVLDAHLITVHSLHPKDAGGNASPPPPTSTHR